MGYFSEQQLREYSTPSFTESVERTMIKEASQTRNTIFLSYSHNDMSLAIGIKNYLASQNLDLYLDILDSGFSTITNRDTAIRIKNQIKELNYFFLLLTRNSATSRWVPWELGLADGLKGVKKIFIIPVEDLDGKSHGNEYLQIYSRIIIADNIGEVAMFKPNDNKGITLNDFLSGMIL